MVGAPVPFAADGGVNLTGWGGVSKLRLAAVAENGAVTSVIFELDGPGSLTGETGTLAPGRYAFLLSVTASAHSTGSSSTMDGQATLTFDP